MAEKIYGPSYISLESALSFYGWIPEHVATITCCTSKRSKAFNTPVGIFSYDKVPGHVMLFSVIRKKTDVGIYFIASPWRAIIHYIYIYKKDWFDFDPLINNLRIEPEHLVRPPLNELETIAELYKSRRIKKFVDSIKKEM